MDENKPDIVQIFNYKKEEIINSGSRIGVLFGDPTLPDNINEQLRFLDVRMDHDPYFTVKDFKRELLTILGHDETWDAHLCFPDGKKLKNNMLVKKAFEEYEKQIGKSK